MTQHVSIVGHMQEEAILTDFGLDVLLHLCSLQAYVAPIQLVTFYPLANTVTTHS